VSRAPGAPQEHRAAADVQARAVVDRMMEHDAFSRWLGVEVLDATVKRAVIRMTVRPEMVNGFGTAHGGIVFALADSAFAFATNSNGEISVAVDCSISYPTAVRPGDVLTATAVEQSSTNRLGFCDVTIRNQRSETVGHFRGTIYRTKKPLFGP
jgi:acyl-CoA thioesterase